MTLRITLPASTYRSVGRYCFLVQAAICPRLRGDAYFARALCQPYEGREFDRTHDRRAAAFAASNGKIKPGGRVWRSSRKSASSSNLSPSAALIERLSVPSLHLSAMVREGSDRNALQLALGHIPATPLPGQAGNVGVTAHRDTLSRTLKDLRTHGQILFSTPNGDFKYVAESLVVEPDDVRALAPTSENVLTLVTCYPFSYFLDRSRVQAVRGKSQAGVTASGTLCGREMMESG